MPRSPVVFVSLLLCACGSYKKDLQTMCDAPTRAELQNADPSMKATALADYISKNITTKDAKDLFASLANVPAEQKPKVVRAELDKVGIGKCAMLDDVWTGAGEPAPAK